MKTYAKRNPEKDRTIPITVDSKTRWITPDQMREIEVSWRYCGGAKFAAMLGDTPSASKTRMFRMFESPKYDYVMITDDPAFEPNGSLTLHTSILELHATVAQYANDSRWAVIK